MITYQKAEGNSVNGEEDHWKVNCPDCEKEYEYRGFFDPDDITECEKCGTKFKTTKVWITDNTFII